MKMVLFFLLIIFSLPAFSEEDKESFIEKMGRYHDIIQATIQGSLDSRGLSWESLFEPNLSSWRVVAQDIDKMVSTSECLSTDCPNYVDDFARVAQSRLGHAEQVKTLENGDSFKLRKALLEKAQTSIYVLVWAIYDDETGEEFRDLLLNKLKQRPNIEIKIIVDGNIANMKGRKILKQLQKSSDGKIQVMKWKSKKYRANGNHRKILIVDKEHVIVGGMNIGNNYSHVKTKDKWRDLDVYIKGVTSGRMAYNQFAEIWNNQIDEHKKLKDLTKLKELTVLEDRKAHIPVVFVDQHPGSAIGKAYHNIHTSIVKLLRDAQKSIDIENAYFIMDPIIRAELEAALMRGVKVRVYTNSDKSVDEDIVSMPVVQSALEAMEMGAEVYLKKGSTLHAKYMIVDNKISMVGSFNLHPRSLRFDAENVAVIFNEDYSQNLTSHFENGIREAIPLTHPDQVDVDWSFISLITTSFYYDFL